MSVREKVLVTGAGGFIGSQLVSFLKRQGYWVRGVDLKYPEFTAHSADDFLLLDLRHPNACLDATRDIDEVYALAADTGGSNFRLIRKVDTARNNLLINLHTLEAARIRRVKRYLYVSTVSLWDRDVQLPHTLPLPGTTSSLPFKHQLFSYEHHLVEQFCLHYRFDHGIDIHVIRIPIIYGPYCPWEGGREYVPAALCRKIALAKLTQATDIEIWGDGTQSRTLCYINDCVSALDQAMHAAHPITVLENSTLPITTSQLADLIAQVAGLTITKRYIPTLADPSVPHLNTNNYPRISGAHPPTLLEQGLVNTYAWIEERVRTRLRQGPTP